MLAVFVAPEWAIDDVEKKEMAAAILDVGQHYSRVLEKFDAKTTAWISFGQAFAAIYLTRAYAIHERRKEERRTSRPPQRPVSSPIVATHSPPQAQGPFVHVNGEKSPEPPAPEELRRATIGGTTIEVEFPKDHPLFRKPN